jgi:hypothetical protein
MEHCEDEVKAAQDPLLLHLKRYLNQSFHARFHMAERVQISVWLVDSLCVAAWQKDPRIILDILDRFIEVREMTFKDEEGHRTGNMLIVLRDLLEATSKRNRAESVQLSPEILKKYMGDDGLPVRGVDLAVGAYLWFLSCLPSSALPDMALMKELTRLSDNKMIAKEIEVKVKAHMKTMKNAGGKK